MPVLLLEDFNEAELFDQETIEPPAIEPPVADQSDRLGAYEDGYKAGWDDATSSQNQDEERVSAEFGRVLQEISITYNDARLHVIRSIEAVLVQLTEKILPDLSNDIIASNVHDLLHPHLEQISDQPITLAVAPGQASVLAETVREYAPTAINLVEEQSVAPNQAFLRTGKIDKKIDASGAFEAVRDAMKTMLELSKETSTHD